MNYVKLTPENIESQHICCAISNNTDLQVVSKKQWLKDRMAEGLVFLKADLRGKCFIEYIPAEYAWVPIEASGYMHINCFWVSGSCKGHGYANDLLEACVTDAKEKGKKGLTVISSPKETPFLSDPKFLKHKGFVTADTVDPYFLLMVLPFEEGVKLPELKAQVKSPQIEQKGFVLYYTHGCPFTVKYVALIESFARKEKIAFKSILIDSRENAQKAPVAWTTYALFYDGKFVTNEILSEKKFIALCEKLGEV